jgi:hypothetical protein
VTRYIPVSPREAVTSRAQRHCEYCRFPQILSFLPFEIEHIIAEKHGGATDEGNLALACPICNRHKGTDLGSLDPETGILTPFFHPRKHHWEEHFRLEDGQILPLTAEGRVTARILHLNDSYRIAERQELIAARLSP